MKWLVGAAFVTAMSVWTADARADGENVLTKIAPYCTHAFSGSDVSKCIQDQSGALIRIEALKRVRGPIVDGIFRLCATGQYPEPGSGVNFVGAFKCVSARISAG